MRILVTGAAGFIGSHLLKTLLESVLARFPFSPFSSISDDFVVGFDNYSSYYSPELKRSRVNALGLEQTIREGNLCMISENWNPVERFDVVVHLAAQPGVRESLRDPFAYQKKNIAGFLNVLEYCRDNKAGYLIYASSSSVYGLSDQMPFTENDPCDCPASFYGATKRANEMMAYSYSVCHGLPCTGLRFFTVYGPWGRPDMAYFGFADQIMHGDPISLYGKGELSRDFTFVDDIVRGILAVIQKGPPRKDPKGVPHRIYNLGNDKPEKVITLVNLLEAHLGRSANKVYTDLPKGDVPHTWANIDKMKSDFGWSPKVSLAEGIKRFSDWYLGFRTEKYCQPNG